MKNILSLVYGLESLKRENSIQHFLFMEQEGLLLNIPIL